MDIYQLQTFYSVAKHLNFTRAAEELSISQPAVSRQIDSLEQYYGVMLFQRSGRSVILTDAGKSLYNMSEHIIALFEKTKSMMDGFKNLEAGSLNIGASTSIGAYFLSPYVMQFIKKYPKINVILEIKSSNEILELLKKNILDVAICPGPLNTSLFFTEPIFTDELVLVSSKKLHDEIIREEFKIENIHNRNLILTKKGSNLRNLIERYFSNFNIELEPLFEVNSIEAIKQLLLSNLGIGFLPKNAIQIELETGKLKIIQSDLSIKRQYYIVHTKDMYPSPAILAFTSFLKKKNFL